jgi:hypothetical protein
VGTLDHPCLRDKLPNPKLQAQLNRGNPIIFHPLMYTPCKLDDYEPILLIKLSRKIEYLVHKRHRSFRHIQNAISKDGCFWLNSVKLNK